MMGRAISCMAGRNISSFMSLHVTQAPIWLAPRSELMPSIMLWDAKHYVVIENEGCVVVRPPVGAVH